MADSEKQRREQVAKRWAFPRESDRQAFVHGVENDDISESPYDLALDWQRSGRQQEIAPGLTAPIPARVTASDVSGYDIDLVLDMTEEGLRPVQFAVTRRPGSPPISTKTIRAIRISEVIREAVEEAVGFHYGEYAEDEDGTRRPVGYFNSTGVRSIRFRENDAGIKEISDDNLRTVGHLFELAQLIGIPPAKYVQEKLGLPRSTAGYWIRRAREEGYLAPPARRDG